MRLSCVILYPMSMIFHHPLLTCTVVVTVNHFNSPHSMYYNILTWLQTGFRVKIANFLWLCCLAIPRRDLSTKKTKPNIEKWSESLGVIRILMYRMLAIKVPSSETQQQIVGTRESLNGRKNVVQRKVKDGEKSPWGQCLTRPVPNGRCSSGFWLVPENLFFSGTNQKPERRQPFGTSLVRHCPQGLFSPFFTFLRSLYIFPPV